MYDYVSRSKMLSELRGGFFPQDVVYTEAVEIAKQIIESAPAEDVVSRGVFEQVKWERDMAMRQLEEHGIPFCGKADDVVKVVRCKGCKHSTWSQEPCHGKVEYRCKLHGFAVDKHFYCASGERREQT